ncbi:MULTISPECIES: DUF3015 family protein [Treponema]|uniref:DUF3015 family protein n=1 Tax=Treponema TaxID=157 RepID=UPI003FD7F57B
MLRKKIAVLVAAGMLALSSSAFATNVGPGLGYVLVGDKTGAGWDLLASWLNGIYWNQWFAITFGTSGYDNGLVGMTETNQFVADNMDALAADIAKGEGEYIDTLSTMLNVSDSVAFKATLQKNFEEIFTSANVSAEEVTSKIYSFVS